MTALAQSDVRPGDQLVVTRPSAPRVLLVDDDALLLAGLRRRLRGRYDVETASGGAEGLARLAASEPFAVVLSDYQMPQMNGAAFLAAARTAAPDTTRMLLTGQADLSGAAAVVNEGGVFRFLLKPASPEAVQDALAAGVEQHRLVLAERELLNVTLRGSMKALTELLALASPLAFARSTRLRRLAGTVFEALADDVPWQVDVALMLSQLGVITLPPQVLERLEAGETLSPDEAAMVARLPALAERVLAGIPRLDEVRDAIRLQDAWYAPRSRDPGIPAGADLPLGARVLRVVGDYDTLSRAGHSPQAALRVLADRGGVYDPALLDALAAGLAGAEGQELRAVAVGDLLIGMVLADDVFTATGVKLAPAGHEVTESLLERIRNFAHMASGVREPIAVLAPGRPA